MRLKFLTAAIVIASLMSMLLAAAPAMAAQANILVFGDSLSAGFGLPPEQSFPAQLEAKLKAAKIDARVTNAGVSGDTTAGGVARLDAALAAKPTLVILELGANDMLRGIDPKVTREALSEIVRRLKARHIEVLLCGMLAAPNLGPDFGRAFNSIYPELAAANDLVLYPFFLDGVVNNPSLNLGDGLHPTAEGVTRIVSGIMPKVEALLARVRAKPAS
jgi:acyl-CoA thioesterase-1